jgi:halocyanin-like protein
MAATGTASAQSDYGGWLSDVGNYDGNVVDATGQDTVTIDVGVQANNGPNGFGPPAVQVNPGTTIVWEWVEGSHNVVDEGGAFETEITAESGFTFEHVPESTGVIKYYCAPHRAMGMKGVVDVVEGSGSGGGSRGSGSGGGSGGESSAPTGPDPTERMGSSGDGPVGGIVVGGLALAFVSPALFAAFVRNRDLGDGPDGGSQ